MKHNEQTKKYRTMKITELKKESDSLAIQINIIAMNVAAGKEKVISKITENRKKLARICTIINQKIRQKDE